FSTDLPPSMTLGCGSWGGNVTSDNVSPIHLMDIKRVAFETKPVNEKSRVVSREAGAGAFAIEKQPSQPPKREQIAAIVDRFLSEKLAEAARVPPSAVQSQQVSPPIPASESPIKTIIHELRPQSLTENGVRHDPVDFVSETDVRTAIDKGVKIYITAKTILTPSARDLGEEKEIFANV
ncbi:MAG: hypothetical protein ABIU09_00975, partial [Pyrinomonadaceae bacterium]